MAPTPIRELEAMAVSVIRIFSVLSLMAKGLVFWKINKRLPAINTREPRNIITA